MTRLVERDWCPVAATLHILSGKWKPTILLHLRAGPRSFSELRRLMPGVTQRVLTMQLRALEADSLIVRTELGGNPPRVSYAFAPRGLSLGPILDLMEQWGEKGAAP